MNLKKIRVIFIHEEGKLSSEFINLYMYSTLLPLIVASVFFILFSQLATFPILYYFIWKLASSSLLCLKICVLCIPPIATIFLFLSIKLIEITV